MRRPKYKNTYRLTYRLELYDSAIGIIYIKPREQKLTLQANTDEQAKQRFYEYNPRYFFSYGEYKIKEVEKVK